MYFPISYAGIMDNDFMPLTQPERDSPLMNRYFREINLPGTRLAKRCGVSHSQMYMARKRNVGPDNAEKISRGDHSPAPSQASSLSSKAYDYGDSIARGARLSSLVVRTTGPVSLAA